MSKQSEADAADAGASQAQTSSRNLLVAVDFSQDSQYACQWLVSNIYRKGDTVHIVHTIPYFPRSGIYVMPDGRLATIDFEVLLRNEDQFLMAAEKAVADWCSEVLERAKVRYVIDLLREKPGAEDKDVIGSAICAKAQELQASVLVIASHAKSGLSEWLLGSVANYLTHHCQAPVLVLHRPKGAEEAGSGGSLGGLRSWLPDLSALLKPKVRAEAVGAASVGASAAGDARRTSRDESGLVTTEDFSSLDDNLLGQDPADFPGLPPQRAQHSNGDSAQLEQHGAAQQAAQHTQHGQQDQATAAAAAAPAQETQQITQQVMEPGPRHIVVPVDDSDESERACMWAVQDVYRPGDRVHLMHIVPALPYRATYGGPVMDGFVLYMEPPTDDFKKAAEQYVGQRFVSKLQELDIPHSVEIVAERAEDSVSGIGSAICKHVAGLPGEAVVVVGSHSRGGLAE
ncbi:hypothetical protein N2152v2_010739 [Parachlorella kessleri]